MRQRCGRVSICSVAASQTGVEIAIVFSTGLLKLGVVGFAS